MLRVSFRRLGWLIPSVLLLAACGGSAGSGSAPGAVEAYLRAIITGDATQVVNLSCPAWEADARTEAASFESVQVSLEGLACQEAGTEGDYTLVTCTGTIVAVYNGENQELPLAGRTYQAALVDGEWKMCGYHQ
jgi:hypothetical protein